MKSLIKNKEGLSDEEIKTAARKYCEMAGMNPDLLIQDDEKQLRPQWEFLCADIAKYEAIRIAIEFAKQE